MSHFQNQVLTDDYRSSSNFFESDKILQGSFDNSIRDQNPLALDQIEEIIG